jgi:heptosyltransferase-3
VTAAFFMQACGKILVIRGGAIGDFILTLPVFGALREMFPGTHLEVLGYPPIAQLAKLGKLADEVRSIEAQSLAGFFARNGTLADELCAYFSSFNIIISYLYDPDEIFQTNVLRCSTFGVPASAGSLPGIRGGNSLKAGHQTASMQFIQGPHRPNEQENVHATDVFLKPLERLAIFGADPIPRLALDPRPSTFDNVIALHPGSGSEKKNWPHEKWCQLVQELVKTTAHHFLIIGGEAEGEKVNHLARMLPPQRVQVLHHRPLTQVAEALASCSFFIGHDSGITHLAAAVGLPGIVLWGETNPSIWRPRNERMKIVPAENGLAQLSIRTVLAALKQEP